MSKNVKLPDAEGEWVLDEIDEDGCRIYRIAPSTTLPTIMVGDGVEDEEQDGWVIIGLAMASTGFIRVSDYFGYSCDLPIDSINELRRGKVLIYVKAHEEDNP